MSSTTQPAQGFGRPVTGVLRRPPWRFGLQGSDTAWAIAFFVPYAVVFLAFVAWPIAYGLWLGSDPALYDRVFSDPRYKLTVINTLLLAGVGVNLKMFLAFLLSGFFLRKERWIKPLLVLFMLPWALPALSAYTSMHWMFIGYGGFLNSALEMLFGIEGPIWFTNYWFAMGINILAYIWKWMPFWTLVFLAGRLAIPQEIYEAADMDGATGLRRFVFVTFPLLANLYLVCVLLSTLWTVGDFMAPYLVSSGAPALHTLVLATYGYRLAFDFGYPTMGLAAVLAALPVLIPLTLLLMRRLHANEVQL